MIGEWVIFTDKEKGNFWKKHEGISLYGKIGKVIARATQKPY